MGAAPVTHVSARKLRKIKVGKHNKTMALIDATLDYIIASQRKPSHQEKLKMSSKASVGTFKVRVENLRQDYLDVKELTEMFSDFGKILSFKVITNNNASDRANDTNVSIRYRSECEAEAAAECWDKVQVGCSTLKVNVVKNKKPYVSSDATLDTTLNESFGHSESSFSQRISHTNTQSPKAGKFHRSSQRKWNKGPSRVTKESLDQELEDYMSQKKQKATAKN